MAEPTANELEDRIEWEFELNSSIGKVRYGKLGEVLYKQYMPGGVVITKAHPPKRISEELYELARLWFNKAG